MYGERENNIKHQQSQFISNKENVFYGIPENIANVLLDKMKNTLLLYEEIKIHKDKMIIYNA